MEKLKREKEQREKEKDERKEREERERKEKEERERRERVEREKKEIEEKKRLAEEQQKKEQAKQTAPPRIILCLVTHNEESQVFEIDLTTCTVYSFIDQIIQEFYSEENVIHLKALHTFQLEYLHEVFNKYVLIKDWKIISKDATKAEFRLTSKKIDLGSIMHHMDSEGAMYL